MAEHANRQENKSSRNNTGTAEKGISVAGNFPGISASHRTQAMAGNQLIPTPLPPPAVLQQRRSPDLAGKPVQMVADKGNKLAKKVAEDWKIDLSSAREFVAWCKTEDEVTQWLEYDTYPNWLILQREKPEEHDPGRIAEIIDKAKVREARENSREEKKKAPPSAEEEQIRIAAEQEEAAAKRRADEKAVRRARWATLNLGAAPATAAQNAVTHIAWQAIEAEYVDRINRNLSISGVYDRTTLEDALAHWATVPRSGDISYISRFKEVQDKSARPDGGANAANLDVRRYQADFIAEVDGYRVNVHVNST